MTGKAIESRAPITIDELKAKVQARYTGQLFEHPNGYGTVELARLKRLEREQINTACRKPDGTWDNMLQNRMAAAFGLVNPKISAEELKEYPDDFIEGIAEEVWRISNDYRDDTAKGDGEPASFFTKISPGTASPLDSEKPLTKSTP
jgi:hypothetical protein